MLKDSHNLTLEFLDLKPNSELMHFLHHPIILSSQCRQHRWEDLVEPLVPTSLNSKI